MCLWRGGGGNNSVEHEGKTREGSKGKEQKVEHNKPEREFLKGNKKGKTKINRMEASGTENQQRQTNWLMKRAEQ